MKILDTSVSYTEVMETFRIGKSTVGGIKKNREKILKFKREIFEMEMSRNTREMKTGKLDQAVYYIGLSRKRMKGILVSVF